MSRIYGKLERENGVGGLGDDDKLDCEITVGSAKIPLEFVDVIVTNELIGTKFDKVFKATIKLHGETDFMLCAEKDDDDAIVKSMVRELKSWLEDCDYEDMFQVLDELKGLKATLCAYIEDISRMEE